MNHSKGEFVLKNDSKNTFNDLKNKLKLCKLKNVYDDIFD